MDASELSWGSPLTRSDWKCGDGVKPVVGFSEDHTDEPAGVVSTFTDKSVRNLTRNRSPVFSIKGRFDFLWLEAMVADLFQVS
jgi:hypothetical protein